MTSKLRVVVADDELVARKRLQRLLEAIPDVELIASFERATDVLSFVEEEAVDVVILDIQMPGLSGIEAKQLLGDDGPLVIFATAHPQHAVEAFDLGAVDYVLKPIEAGRLAKALSRARREPAADASNSGSDRLPVSTRAGIVLLAPESVSHAVFDGSLVTIHTSDGEKHLADASLQDLQDRLTDERYERVHRRALLNLHEVALLQPTESGGYIAKMRSGGEVPVSRQSARRLRRALGIAKDAKTKTPAS